MGVLRMGVLRLEDAHGDKISAQARSDGRRIAAWPWVENVPCRLKRLRRPIQQQDVMMNQPTAFRTYFRARIMLSKRSDPRITSSAGTPVLTTEGRLVTALHQASVRCRLSSWHTCTTSMPQ